MDCERPTPRLNGPGSALGLGLRDFQMRALADDLALHAADRVLVDSIAKIERIHVEAVGQLVDGLLERECPLRMTRRAKRGGRAGVGEHVVLFDVQRGPLVEVRAPVRRSPRPCRSPRCRS